MLILHTQYPIPHSPLRSDFCPHRAIKLTHNARVESQELRCSFLVQLFIFFLWHTWLCFQIVSSIARGSTSPVSWLRFSDMKRSTWVLSEFSQVLSLQIKTWGFSFWRENVSAKDRTSTQFSRSRADSKYWEQSWTTHFIWKKQGD